jgi:membrane protein CcdC involved in cytochrome C biogenesis
MHIPGGISILASLAGLAAVILWRVREARTAVSIRKIVAPPLGMATGFSMFLVPSFRIPWTWAGGAFLVGVVALAYPLLKTSRLVLQGEVVMMRRSGAFFATILLLAAVRILARAYFDTFVSPQQTAALFFVLAFGMILRWRTQMLLQFRVVRRRNVCADSQGGQPAEVA